jgi:anti-sigma B factor antagonist
MSIALSGSSAKPNCQPHGIIPMLRPATTAIKTEEDPMKIEIRAVEDAHILDVSGQITLGEGTMVIRNTVRDVMQTGVKKIILNLADVTYIDSSGVGELVSTYTTVVNNGGQLKLLNLTKKIRELLTITKLLTVFDVSDNEQAMLAGFK